MRILKEMLAFALALFLSINSAVSITFAAPVQNNVARQNHEFREIVEASDNNFDENDSTILYQYSKEELEAASFTMDIFNEYYSREDVKRIVAINKAANTPASYEYRKFDVSEKEIDDFYDEMKKIANRDPSLSYYFSNVYWQIRNGMVTLTLVPTSVIKNDVDRNYRAASWLLVKQTCDSSSYWTNESSISMQYDCHYIGEYYAYYGYISPIGNWDIEPARSASNLFVYLINQCNP